MRKTFAYSKHHHCDLSIKHRAETRLLNFCTDYINWLGACNEVARDYMFC